MSEYSNSDYFEYNGERVDFHYKTEITPTEMAQFVNNVLMVVVGDNYYPFLSDLMFDYELVHWFTDIDIADYTTGERPLDDYAEFFKNTGLSTNMKINVPSDVREALYSSVMAAIEYKTGMHINLIEASVSKLIDTIDEKIGDMDLVDVSNLSDIVNGLQGELTANKVVEAYKNSKLFGKGN